MPKQAKVYGDITVAIQKPMDGKLTELYGDNPQIEMIWLVPAERGF